MQACVVMQDMTSLIYAGDAILNSGFCWNLFHQDFSAGCMGPSKGVQMWHGINKDTTKLITWKRNKQLKKRSWKKSANLKKLKTQLN